MYVLIAEDKSDFETLKIIIARLSEEKGVSIKGKGYKGCAEMLRKGAALFDAFPRGNRFIVCYDSDREDPDSRYIAACQVFLNSKVTGEFCAVVPKQEIEAWILADIECAKKVCTSWAPDPEPNPEAISDPKEYLERLSQNSKKRPVYAHATHNPRMAEHLDLDKVEQKCPSFKPLASIVKKGKGNVNKEVLDAIRRSDFRGALAQMRALAVEIA